MKIKTSLECEIEEWVILLGIMVIIVIMMAIKEFYFTPIANV